MRNIRSYSGSKLFCLGVTITLYAAGEATTITQTHTAELQPTMTVTRGVAGAIPKVNRKTDSRRIKAFNGKKWLISSYLSAVDKSILALLKHAAIPNMMHNDWRKDFRAPPAESNTFFGASLWKMTHPRDPVIWQSLRCNIYRDDGFGATGLAPNVYIRKPVRDLRFEWFIHTGNANLDWQIEEIVVSEAKKF